MQTTLVLGVAAPTPDERARWVAAAGVVSATPVVVSFVIGPGFRIPKKPPIKHHPPAYRSVRLLLLLYGGLFDSAHIPRSHCTPLHPLTSPPSPALKSAAAGAD